MTPWCKLVSRERGELLRWFPGPPRGAFVFDEHLFVSAEGHGTSVWDVATGGGGSPPENRARTPSTSRVGNLPIQAHLPGAVTPYTSPGDPAVRELITNGDLSAATTTLYLLADVADCRQVLGSGPVHVIP